MKHATTLLALGTLCLSLACSQAASSSSDTSTIDFAEMLPPGTRFIKKVCLDTDNNGSEEWIVFYHFDLTNDAGDSGPVGGVVYRSLKSPLQNLTVHCLLPNSWCFDTYCPSEASSLVDNRYLCDGECSAKMEDVIAKAAGKELVIRDKVGQETTKVTIFSWTRSTAKDCPESYYYEMKGQFSGDRVIVKENSDTIIVDTRSQEFAQFAVRLTYSTEDTGSFYKFPDVPFEPDYEMILFSECDNVMLSPYPEKTIMAFYSHYNEETAQKYFAAGLWEQLEKCAGKFDCGCSVPPDQVEHVQVKKPPESDFSTQDDAKVSISVQCRHKDKQVDPEMRVTWYLERAGDGQWKIKGLEHEETTQPTPPSSPITPSP